MELNKIKGIGPKTLSLLNKLNIDDIDDLIRYYPYRYNFYKPMNLFEVNEEDTAIISGTITSSPKVSYIKRNFNRLSFTFETNNINCNVAIFNRAYLSTHLSIGKQITLIGKYNKLKNSFTASDIKLYPLYKTEVEPVYHLVSGINRTTVKKCIDNALTSINEVNEIVPELISDRYELMKTLDAIKEIHNPTTPSNLKKARIKLKYEELFEFMFKINLIKYKN
jgi:ATP-dependent DNA helicase RecG